MTLGRPSAHDRSPYDPPAGNFSQRGRPSEGNTSARPGTNGPEPASIRAISRKASGARQRTRSLRSQILTAIISISLGTLAVTWLGTYVIVSKSASNNSATAIRTEAEDIATVVPNIPEAQTSELLTHTGFTAADFIAIASDGSYSSLSSESIPQGISAADISTSALLAGNAVAGTEGNLAYAVVPLPLRPRQMHALQLPLSDTVALVVTKTTPPPANGLGYFILIGILALAVGSLVAWEISRRFGRSLATLSATTERIASGHLDARAETGSQDLAEIASLTDSINEMAVQLSASRQAERQFLLSVSHELRTPLTSIRGYAEALAEGAADDTGHAVGVILSEATRLERLIKDLLDLAHLQSGKFSLNLQRVDAATVLAQVEAGLKPEAESRGINLHAPSRTDLVPATVMADPDRLRQVLANLVENALRFTKSSIALGFTRQANRVVLTVADDGPGIPADELPRIFSRHYRADRSGGKGGTGLGLAIVAELVNAMGGRVQARSGIYTDPVTVTSYGTAIDVDLPLA